MILADALGTASLESYEVVVLCNVPVIPDSFVQKLQDFLRQGGGVLIFSGDRVQADGYQKLARSSPPLCRSRTTVKSGLRQMEKKSRASTFPILPCRA